MSTIAEEQGGRLRSELIRCQCSDCVEVRSRAIKLPDPVFWRGDEKHGSGTIIHWDWRDPEHRKEDILITCHFCGHDSFVRKQSILRLWKGERGWRGLCSLDAQLPVRRTLKGKHKNPFGAIIDFDKSPHDHNRAWVYCPNYSTCEGLEQRRVDKYNKDTQPFYCRKCLGCTRSSNLSQAWLLLKTGVGDVQKKGCIANEPKPRRKREPLITVNGKSLADLDASILKLYDEKRVNSLVTLEFVAQDAGLGRAGVGDGGQKNVSRLFKRNQVIDSFPIYRDKLIAAWRASIMP
jgi:hypothetical protein